MRYFIRLWMLIVSIYLVLLVTQDYADWWEDNPAVPALLGSVADDDVRRAMIKMGPGYHYKLIRDVLYVDKGDGT